MNAKVSMSRLERGKFGVCSRSSRCSNSSNSLRPGESFQNCRSLRQSSRQWLEAELNYLRKPAVRGMKALGNFTIFSSQASCQLRVCGRKFCDANEVWYGVNRNRFRVWSCSAAAKVEQGGPRIPKSIHDISNGDHILGFGAQLTKDHPVSLSGNLHLHRRCFPLSLIWTRILAWTAYAANKLECPADSWHNFLAQDRAF